MIDKIIVLSGILLFCSSCTATKESEISEYPRMPEAYRKSDYKDFSKRNPYGMSIYDAAETEAEENYFGTEVVSVEESKRILEERKKQQNEKEQEKLNQGVDK